MNIHNTILTSVKDQDDYGCFEFETKKFSDLSKVELQSILNYILSLNIDQETILNRNGFYSLEQVKEKKGLKFTNKDDIFYRRNYNFEKITLGKKLNDYQLEELSQWKQVFVLVEMPKEIKDQLEVFEQKKKEKKKKLEEAKKTREIKKAKKLLEQYGEK
jgi:hypothetical protein